MKKIIAHYKYTNCANAPDEIVQCINKYSEKYKAILVHQNDPDAHKTVPQLTYNTEEEAIQKIKENDISFVHYHNKYLKDLNIPSVIQYHSPPWYSSSHWTDLSYPGNKLVVGQYQATLKEYSMCTPIPNIIDIYSESFVVNKTIGDTIKIGYSPSVKNKIGVESKGYDITIEILEKIKNMYEHVEIDVIYGVPLKKCLQRKSQCDIIIDECVTNSYHRSGLEGLGLGKLTICSLDNDVINVVKKMMNIDFQIPFENIWIQDLETELIRIINTGKQYIQQIGDSNRMFMETYWNPKLIVQIFENIYDRSI